jgi:hypothetical protein
MRRSAVDVRLKTRNGLPSWTLVNVETLESPLAANEKMLPLRNSLSMIWMKRKLISAAA